MFFYYLTFIILGLDSFSEKKTQKILPNTPPRGVLKKLRDVQQESEGTIFLVYISLSRSFSVYLGLFGLSWSILVHLGASRSISVYLDLSWSILVFLGLSQSIMIYFELSRNISDYL